MNAKFICYGANSIKDIEKYLLVWIHDVPIVHVSSIELLAHHILNIIVDSVRIINTDDLR